MRGRDDEDLAVEQLPAPAGARRAGELEPAHGPAPSDQEQGAEQAQPEVPTLPSLADLEALTDRLRHWRCN